MAFLAPILGSLASGLFSKIFKFEEGGMVKAPKGKPTMAIVHGGERVLTGKENKTYEKVMKQKGMKVSKKGGEMVKITKAKKEDMKMKMKKVRSAKK